jgi:hypothetical protein
VPAEVLTVSQNLTAFLGIHSADKQWKAIHCEVASISTTRVSCRLINSGLVVQRESMRANVEEAKFVLHL